MINVTKKGVELKALDQIEKNEKKEISLNKTPAQA